MLTYDPSRKVLRGVDAVIANDVSLIKVFREDFSLYRIDGEVKG
jgi:collagenase-like PrtC family protease